MFQCCSCTKEGIRLQTQFLGDSVRGMKTDPVNVTRESVGVSPDEFDRLHTVGFVDSDGAIRPESVGMEKEHDVPHDLLLRPGIFDPLASLPSDSIDFLKTL